ncbi:hypothetical protein B2J86_14495 [Acidovorax sp. SRB_14]|uniref:DUF1178 family protein n=1 Tax=Acidovorax sp. SRB_14 TaxID=1962699 RepID=UPI00156669A9|nr:DUF1178 family protein [Acidovorax sp. SRB_14]NMM82120.1 hypothetical protein [Acidovorax sp. SRB_14]
MKVLDLRCQKDHAFEGWFGGEADFQDQLQRGLLQCPLCGDAQVRKVLSAPRIQRAARDPAGGAAQESAAPVAAAPAAPAAAASLQAAWLQWARKIAAQTENVGPRFADEARRMHYGEAPERAIRGQASLAETVELLDEGIAVLPLALPDGATDTLQ